MRGQVGIRRDFQEQLPIRETIRPESFVESDLIVADRTPRLPVEGDSGLLRLMAQAGFMDGFQQTRAGHKMHPDGQPDHLFGRVTRQQHPFLSSCCFVISVLNTSSYGRTNHPADAETTLGSHTSRP